MSNAAPPSVRTPRHKTQEPATLIAPTPQKNRILTLDALRGFALLGVLVTNMLQGYSYVRSGADETVAMVIHAFAEGSFFPMFSFLFGLGFALQLRKGEAALPRFRRRLWVLLGIGLAHLLLIWIGDILFTYALLGFVLVLFRNKKDNVLLFSALGMWLFSVSLIVLISLSEPAVAAPELEPSSGFVGNSYLAITLDRLASFPDELIGLVFGGPLVLALFVIGYLVGRKGVREMLANTHFLRRVALLSALVSAPFTLWYLGVVPLFAEAGWLYALEYVVAGPAQAFFYLATLSLLATPLWNIVKLFVPVGQMALSNYLGQSIICTTLFYPYALGLYDSEPGTATGLLFSLGIFALQILVSAVWLRYFRFGPAEWLWRSLTYGKRQPLLKRRVLERHILEQNSAERHSTEQNRAERLPTKDANVAVAGSGNTIVRAPELTTDRIIRSNSELGHYGDTTPT